ncbi:MAG: hypothetical protein ACI9OD_001333 [Limisphaerales bacterium]|jgi:hypothetical protein
MKILTGTILTGLCLFFFVCPTLAQTKAYTLEDIKRGGELADVYCSVCHQRPDPSILSSGVWDRDVIPNMAAIMGLFDDFYGDERERVLKSGMVLRVPPLSMSEFQLIAAYYVSQSKPKLELAPRKRLPATDLFQIKSRRYKRLIPMDALAKVDDRNGDIFVGGSAPEVLQRLHIGKPTVEVLASGYVPTRVVSREEGIYVAGMGRYVPTELQEGLVQFIPERGDGFGSPITLLKDLPRTADLSIVDINGDGLDDIVLCLFGFYTGRFSWFENLGDWKYREHVLFERSGAIRAIVKDLNKDGHLDIAVLMAQAIETLYFMLNDGTGVFDAEPILRQHPAWGYTNFELTDIDGDGTDDLLTTNGDLDYHAPVRPYHGFRVYRGQKGDFRKFDEVLFREIGGAYDFASNDFDADGDLDVVALGYTPEALDSERVVYFENRGDEGFRVFRVRGGEEGRWLQFDAGDIDGDGDKDLVFAANAAGPGTSTGGNMQRFENWIQFPVVNLVLENVCGDSRASRVRKLDQQAHYHNAGSSLQLRLQQ